MRKKTRRHKGLILALVLVALVIIWIRIPDGEESASILNPSQPFEMEVSAPSVITKYGQIVTGLAIVEARGRINGNGVLYIYDSQGRLLSSHPLSNNVKVSRTDPELWASEIKIVWEPASATEGRIDLYIVCGGHPSHHKEWLLENGA